MIRQQVTAAFSFLKSRFVSSYVADTGFLAAEVEERWKVSVFKTYRYTCCNVDHMMR